MYCMKVIVSHKTRDEFCNMSNWDPYMAACTFVNQILHLSLDSIW